jgi:hypothetical protein
VSASEPASAWNGESEREEREGRKRKLSQKRRRLVLLRIPDFRDRDFRIFKPILKKGFESDPDLKDPNPQIPQKRSVTVITAERINAQIQAILGAFYLATKIRILALKIRIFFLPQKRAKGSDL